jgi:hypothetical protein
VKTSAGYCIYHPQTENFERDMRQVFSKLGMKSTPNIIYIDRHKNLWGYQPGKGVFCYDMQQQLLYEFGYTDDAHGVPKVPSAPSASARTGPSWSTTTERSYAAT